MTLATSIMKTSEGLFQCLKCGYQSKKRDHVVRHNGRIHETLPKIKCPICGKVTLNEYSLAEHTRIAHKLKLSDLKKAASTESAQPAAKKIKKE